MINDGINDVPDKTIAVFTNPFKNSWQFSNQEKPFNVIEKPPKKRDWFSPHFYKCLPLTIGNQYGFIIKNQFDFSFFWNGQDSPESIFFDFYKNKQNIDNLYPRIESHFGHGIITINPPFNLRTPSGVNLMTINPPNYIIPNITVMSGVVETDNIRQNFTFNLKIQMPNIQVNVPAGTPLAAFIPIPRYYADKFELKSAEDIFDQIVIDEEIQASTDSDIFREEIEPSLQSKAGKKYMMGIDIYQNKFSDHQKP
jgi:hypothetical protein